VQLEDAGTLVPQVLAETKKSAGSVPVMAVPLKLIADVPLLVSVAVFDPLVFPTATLPQVIDVGDTVVVPPEDVVPVPESATVWEAPPAVMLQDAVSVPVAAGLKRMEAVQLADAPRDEPQVVDETAKSLALVPEIPAALRVTELVVPLVTVMV
jgi:hypothetical protein